MRRGSLARPLHDRPAPVLGDAERALFKETVGTVTPLATAPRVVHDTAPPAPIPRWRMRDQREVIVESLRDPERWDESTEADADSTFVRPGIARHHLRRLRNGEWGIQSELDLHGLTRQEAKLELADFLYECKRRGVRCVRIIHGKGLGSPNREPVLKFHVRHWLTQREEILAFVEARPVDGGSGAVIVLLKGR